MLSNENINHMKIKRKFFNMKYPNLQYSNATSSIFLQDTSRHVVESKLGLALYAKHVGLQEHYLLPYLPKQLLK